MEVIRKKMSNLKLKLDEAEVQAREAEEKLEVTIQKADDTELEVEELQQKLAALEDELDAAESRQSKLTEELTEAEKQAEEGRRAHKELEARGNIDYSRLNRLQNELEDVTTKNEDIEERYAVVIDKLSEDELQLDEEEDRCSIADTRVKELEAEVVQVGNSLRSMEINEEKASKSSDQSANKLSKKETLGLDMEERAKDNEQRSIELEAVLNDLEDQLADTRTEYDKSKAEYDQLLAELSDL